MLSKSCLATTPSRRPNGTARSPIGIGRRPHTFLIDEGIASRKKSARYHNSGYWYIDL